MIDELAGVDAGANIRSSLSTGLGPAGPRSHSSLARTVPSARPSSPFTTMHLQQQGGQTVNYYYDSNPLNSTYSSNVRGRLAAVTFEGAGSQFAYMYSYNQAGRVTSQRMADADHVFDTGYTWDNEGRMTTMAYPDSGPTYQMTFDAMGRLGSMQAGVGGSTVATATYGIAGEVTALSYFGASETRTYNSVLQMTRQTVSGMMDMEYLFTPGANNGRIASSVDHVLGETLNYSYDGVNRLTLAETPGSGTTNVAVGRPATQSSTFGSASAGKAVDGNTDGSYSNGSVSVTNGDANAWWQVDLGLARSIDSVEIFNRTDCCGSRLSDYWVFVSNTPFLATDTPATLVNRAGTWSNHQTSMPNPSVGLTVGGYQGRYVRVQLAGTEYLQLAEVKVNAVGWGQGFGYDGFGNLTTKTATKGSAPVMSVSFDPATNRQYGVSYDANGNPDGPIYDVENRKLADSYAVYPQNGYDHAGKRVKRMTATGMEYYVYGIGGQKLETLTCEYHTYGVPPETYTLLDCGASFYVYFGGKLVKSKGVVVATDRLGSVRANGNGERFAYYPYGEERGTSGDGREKFGTYVRDSATVDYADQRYYGVGTGRFNVPDPSMDNIDYSDPTSWNAYSYVNGDPVNFTDPEGLVTCGDLPVEGGGTVSSSLLADSDAGRLTRLVWAEGGTLAANGNSTSALGLSQELIAQAMVNRLSIANGLAAVRGKDGLVYWGDGGAQGTTRASILGYGSRGTTLAQEIVRAAAGTNEVNSAGELNDMSGINRTLGTELGDATRALPGRLQVEGTGYYVTPECYRAISAMQATNTILGGTSLNAPGFFVTSWKANGNSNPDRDRLYTLAVVGGTTFYGFGAYQYTNYKYPTQLPPRRGRF